MIVHVNLHFFPNYCGGRKNADVELPEGADVRQLLQALGIPNGETGVMLMNKEHVAFDDKAVDGAQLDIYPIVAGG